MAGGRGKGWEVEEWVGRLRTKMREGRGSLNGRAERGQKGIRLRGITMRSNVVNINETKVISVSFFLSNGLFEGVCADELRDYEGSPAGTELRASLRLLETGGPPVSARCQ